MKDGVDDAAEEALREPHISLRVLTKKEAEEEEKVRTKLFRPRRKIRSWKKM